MNLIANEMMKIFKKTSTYIMIGLLIVIIIGIGGLSKYFEVKDGQTVESGDWKQALNAETEQMKADAAAIPQNASFFNKQIAINEYRLANDLPPPNETNTWVFLNDMISIIDFIAIITITVAAGIVASEFSTGTIKLLLIRPVSRVKILLSKYVSVILFSVGMLLLSFFVLMLVGAVLFGFGDAGSYLAYVDGEVVERTQLGNALFMYAVSSIGLFMLTTMAFMVSAAFRNSSLAIGLSIFLLMAGVNLTYILSMKFDWAKYSLFANISLMDYIDGEPLVEGMTLGFSVGVLVVYFLIFHLVSLLFFVKRDVRA